MTWYHYSESGTKTKVGELDDVAWRVEMSLCGTDPDEKVADALRSWLLERFDIIDLVRDVMDREEDEDEDGESFDDLIRQFTYDKLVEGDGLSGYRQEAENGKDTPEE